MLATRAASIQNICWTRSQHILIFFKHEGEFITWGTNAQSLCSDLEHLSNAFCIKKNNHKPSKAKNNAQVLEYTGTEMGGEADPGIMCSVLMAAVRISSWKLLSVEL